MHTSINPNVWFSREEAEPEMIEVVPRVEMEHVDREPREEEEEKDDTERIILESRESKDSFKTVHSKNSLRNVVKTVENSYLETIAGRKQDDLPNPLVVTEDSHTGVGRRKGEKAQNHVQTLPYLHRNPAI
jgi:hypothetical protein